MDYGFWCLLPIIFIIVFAILTKRGIAALLLGVILSYMMLHGFKFVLPLVEDMITAIGDYDSIWILLICAFIGSLALLLQRSKGVNGLARVLSKFANGPKKSLITAWIAGLIIFFDDYLNIFVVGNLMKKVTDRNKVPREMLAYVVDSTAAPVCLVVPLSSWVVFFSVLLGDQPEFQHLGSGTSIYLHSIPFIFYAWFTIIIVPFVIFGIIPKFKPMKQAFNRALNEGKLYSDESAKLVVNIEEIRESREEAETGNALDFALPVIAVIAITIFTEDVLIGLIAGNVACFLMYLPRRIMKFGGFCDTMIDGFASSAPLIAICAIAVFAREGFTQLGIANYIISITEPYLVAELFPMLTFIIVACLAFVTVSCWGMVAVSIPILVPLSVAAGADPFLTVGAILSGSGFGSHACPYEDASVMSAQVTGISPIEHFKTQAPFAVIGAILSCIAFLILGFIF
jgi:Na+/H+ antiporter NhaC